MLSHLRESRDKHTGSHDNELGDTSVEGLGGLIGTVKDLVSLVAGLSQLQDRPLAHPFFNCRQKEIASVPIGNLFARQSCSPACSC
jgi:hypothetical protein